MDIKKVDILCLEDINDIEKIKRWRDLYYKDLWERGIIPEKIKSLHITYKK